MIEFKLLRAGAKLPARGTCGSGGFDIYAPMAGIILPGERQMVQTGLAHQINDGPAGNYYRLQGIIMPRSGLASKRGVRLFFAPCLIDHDYRGENGVLIENAGDCPFEWAPGERLCQIVYSPVYMGECGIADDLSATERGAGGFGSTGN